MTNIDTAKPATRTISSEYSLHLLDLKLSSRRTRKDNVCWSPLAVLITTFASALNLSSTIDQPVGAFTDRAALTSVIDRLHRRRMYIVSTCPRSLIFT